ncbi:MAG TPA: phosphoribosyltransferase family protein [Burkholderiaceae bacterium]|nr:phosphoribosyltransferase family protein [Burkholderiaceae bacterium]
MQSSSQIETAIANADLVLPVPLSNERLRERGYNQAHELCKRIASFKSDPHLLLRVKHTDAQSRLKRTERLKNVAAAFAIDPLRTAEIKGKRVVLIDDVMTSGATLFAAAKVLRQAQAKHITGVVFARTEIQ